MSVSKQSIFAGSRGLTRPLVALEMLCLLKPPVTDSALSKNHDEAHGEASQRAAHVFQIRFLGRSSFDGGGGGGNLVSQPRGLADCW
jgi:hypothetical protein